MIVCLQKEVRWCQNPGDGNNLFPFIPAQLPPAPIPTLVPIRKGGGENAKVFYISQKLKNILMFREKAKVFQKLWKKRRSN